MNSGTTPLFSDAMILRPIAGHTGQFEANLNEHWTIGPKVHGGVMVALCAKAAREAYREPGGDAVQPVAVSANFLSAPDPGPVRLVTSIRKRGRRIGLVDVELLAGDRACVHAVVTLGELQGTAESLLSANPVTPLMSSEPPADVGAHRTRSPRRRDQQPGPGLRHPACAGGDRGRRHGAGVQDLGPAQTRPGR